METFPSIEARWGDALRAADQTILAVFVVEIGIRVAAYRSAAAEAGCRPDVLVQVDLAGEATKFGAPPDEAKAIVQAAAACQAVRLAGLMLLPPFVENPEGARPYFVRLRALRDGLVGAGVPPHLLRELSMGMSHDFEVAIEEGATMIRVGQAIFGARSR